jgi:tetratricopeptide (TPR) repeat protein
MLVPGAGMKRDTLTAIAASALVWLVGFPTVAANKEPGKTDTAIFAICRVEQYVAIPDASRRLTIENGMGDGGFAIATTNASAQAWFDYGIKLFHAFYHEDAKLAFDNAVAADPNCAMCLWGQALSRGPTQNYDVSKDDLKTALEMARKALAAANTNRDRALAEAMIRRYSREQDAAAERDFAADLRKADAQTPDLQLLAAEMLLTAWRRGDHGAAPEAMALVESVLQQTPQNTAAIHYYIHATEMSGKAALALAYADKLAALAPKASHLVHMAAHTFFHVGRYEDAATINAFALKVDADHMTDTKAPGIPGDAYYYGHNLNFGMAGALMSGDGALALKFADHLHRAWPDKAFARDGMSDMEGQRFIIYARYDPARLWPLREPSGRLARALYHYARGEAYAAKHDAAGVMREAATLRGNSAALAVVAAAVSQDTILGTAWDPPPWWYPVRRSAAAAYLLDGQFAKAAEVAMASLQTWPDDPLTLLILSRAKEGLGRTAEARDDSAKAAAAWEGDIAKVDIATI